MICQVRRIDQVLIETDTVGKAIDMAIGLCLHDKDGRGTTVYCDGIAIQHLLRLDNVIHIQPIAPLAVASLSDVVLRAAAK
jgi:hypothetical protein